MTVLWCGRTWCNADETGATPAACAIRKGDFRTYSWNNGTHPTGRNEILFWRWGYGLGGLDAEEEEVGEVVGDDDAVEVEGGPGVSRLREPYGDVL
jgi:hypothetical protein